MWITANIAHAEDPDTGREVMVGTFRDVTAEHYSVQRQAALGRAECSNWHKPIRSTMRCTPRSTSCAAVVGPLRTGGDVRRRSRCTDESRRPGTDLATRDVQWADLPPQTRERITALGRSGDLLTVDTAIAGSARASHCNIRAEPS